jgi:hypothetical protein
MAPAEKRGVVRQGGSSYQRVMSEKDKEKAAMEEMFVKAKRLDIGDEEEPIEGIPTSGNTDVGFDDDDWN